MGISVSGPVLHWQKTNRGSYALDLKPASLVTYTENHDQLANTAYGSRLNEQTTSGRYKAITAFHLLGPNTPMLFQGQEYGASTPFLYFADHNPELADLVKQGRAEFLAQFKSIGSSGTEFAMGCPHDRVTFERCKLNLEERLHNEQHGWLCIAICWRFGGKILCFALSDRTGFMEQSWVPRPLCCVSSVKRTVTD